MGDILAATSNTLAHEGNVDLWLVMVFKEAAITAAFRTTWALVSLPDLGTIGAAYWFIERQFRHPPF